MTQQAKITKTTATVRGQSYTRYVVRWYEGKKRQRKTFSTLAEAEAEAKRKDHDFKIAGDREKIIRKRIGEDGTKLTADALRDAVEALAVLKDYGSLTDAATYFMKYANPKGGEKTIEECRDLFLKRCETEGLRPATIRSYSQQTKRLCNDMKGMKMHEITLHVFEEWLSKVSKSQGTRKSYLRHLGAFFNYAIARGYMVDNPTANLGAKSDKNIVHYLTPAEAHKMLVAAEDLHPELVPYIAIGLFAGVRPSEMHGQNTDHAPLDWQHIHLTGDKPHIDLKPEQDKNRNGRRVDISKNLLKWLLPYAQERGAIEYSRPRFEAIVKQAGIQYRKDAMRHSFGTWHHAMYHHKGETAVQLGDTIDTVTKHYVNDYVLQDDAAKFWGIKPNTKGKALRLRSAA